MKIHKEGYPSIFIILLFCGIQNTIGYIFLREYIFVLILLVLESLFLLIVVLQFFRSPQRSIIVDDSKIISPADGKIVVIEETEEPEYFKDRRLQVSVFMSPTNVHVNYYPFSGLVSFFKYHKGEHLVAWHPKSSTKNERSTIVLKRKDGTEILVRQIAGAIARRVVSYAKEGADVKQGEQIGFIKFGSRVDLFLPIGTKLNVELEQLVTGCKTVLGGF